ncbi:hypothetical protein JJB07_18540 [Tumebacillus sp. ITR2]|uniref:Uncharacterized protein n=1 Tax=Tumebacillus amylolyticus TaxID=2801339 RepID=A0ABS1JE83_9BACL|nr:hypothetical protein [Tumebacillus amylolyticus]MBL0388607.1 hypothetical protein [Tumebacillus amylolyticus]
MGIIIGLLVAVVLWKILKLSVLALVWIAIIGAIVGAIPTFMRRRAKR